MYGYVTVWGCKWFQLWREHVKTAVSLNQRLQVFYFEDRVGKGKVQSWSACKGSAIRRDAIFARRGEVLQSLSDTQKQHLSTLSSDNRDDSKGERPGNARQDEEDRIFMESLPEEDKLFLESGDGLGNSQKCEVAWLEDMGYAYEELSVRDFHSRRTAASARRLVRNPLTVLAKETAAV
jgi:hypothetical protein